MTEVPYICPLCRVPHENRIPRYPYYVCWPCLSDGIWVQGRKRAPNELDIYNVTEVPCKVKGVDCIAREAHMGGLVVHDEITYRARFGQSKTKNAEHQRKEINMVTAYYRRMNLINLAVGIYLVLSGLFMTISDTLFFVSIALIVALPIFVARQTKGYADAKALRGAVFKDKSYLIWISILVIFVIPLLITYVSHSRFDLDYNNVGFLFIGLSSWFNVLFNSFTLPLYKAHTGKNFD